SQTGPMVLIMVRLPRSSLPRKGSNPPTPKSKPSSTKKPIHSTAMSTNHSSLSHMSLVLSVREGQGAVGLGGPGIRPVRAVGVVLVPVVGVVTAEPERRALDGGQRLGLLRRPLAAGLEE